MKHSIVCLRRNAFAHHPWSARWPDKLDAMNYGRRSSRRWKLALCIWTVSYKLQHPFSPHCRTLRICWQRVRVETVTHGTYIKVRSSLAKCSRGQRTPFISCIQISSRRQSVWPSLWIQENPAFYSRLNLRLEFLYVIWVVSLTYFFGHSLLMLFHVRWRYWSILWR